ncbi:MULTISPECIES: hypothetical protein [Rhizobiaceae]|uniref:hypothetical protein n=1 Tax=Rhizobiaceae TaxID=82115 RepID=UPI000E3BA48B|nr:MULTISPECIES: hypothetical protein [Rhizobiaceae]MBX4893421.1 hypothetical protein [Rhizobium bangladeshense]MBX4917427.1 hypothetical protein [Rhizobium bangladeshense]MDF1631470.1 hypothetical protein [Mycoplana sp. MJR14]QSY97537.1 hypothetical protein J2J97_27195 [Rhizobium bangladeshense]
MPKQKIIIAPALVETWTLAPAATFGSFVRAKGILLEVRASLPVAVRKSLDVNGMALVLGMAKEGEREFASTKAAVTRALEGIESLPVIPREIQDILGISAGERHRWLKDGRLPSAGTRTVRLSGRARQITFHVFDPRVVEDLLDRGAVDEWREEDIAARAENRRQAAYRAKLTRSLKNAAKKPKTVEREIDAAASKLLGWDEFDVDGLLR